MANKLYLTFEGSRIREQGVPVDALVSALQGVQDALQLMVEHLSEYKRRPGKPPKWIKDQSGLQLSATRPGSFVAELILDPAAIASDRAEEYGEQAFEALQRWDGGDASTLPRAVVDRLWRIQSKLPEDTRLWLGDSEIHRRAEIDYRDRFAVGALYSSTIPQALSPSTEEALVYGWLKVINWDKRTAQLHRYGDRHVPLQFDADLDDEMRRVGNQYVEVRGEGRINRNDRWQWVRVEEIAPTRSSSEPFDIEAFLNNPNPKIFDPETIVTASEPFDVDEFIRVIHEGREAGLEESLD